MKVVILLMATVLLDRSPSRMLDPPEAKKVNPFLEDKTDYQDRNFITQAFPYSSTGQSYRLNTHIDVNGTPTSGHDDHNGLYVYFTNDFPMTIKNPFLMYSLPRVYDLYDGLASPFNLHHPTNYRYGMHPFIMSQNMPKEDISEPFKTGLYEGFNYRSFSNPNQHSISPIIPMNSPVMNGGTFGTNPIANPQAFASQRKLGLLPFGRWVRI